MRFTPQRLGMCWVLIMGPRGLYQFQGVGMTSQMRSEVVKRQEWQRGRYDKSNEARLEIFLPSILAPNGDQGSLKGYLSNYQI